MEAWNFNLPPRIKESETPTIVAKGKWDTAGVDRLIDSVFAYTGREFTYYNPRHRLLDLITGLVGVHWNTAVAGTCNVRVTGPNIFTILPTGKHIVYDVLMFRRRVIFRWNEREVS